MFTRNVNLFLCLLSALSGHVTARSKEFDVLIFTQRWPKSICIVWKEESPSHSCALPTDSSEWTIHGLWPSQFHRIGPLFCDPSKPFNPAALIPLENEMKEKWIDIEFGRESYGLWKHEWNKHGTCAAVLPPLSTEEKYFAMGLSLLNQYDMKNVLASASILPGGNYAYSDLNNAVQQALGVHPVIVCRKDRETGYSYLFEVRICLNKALELIDCDGVYEYPTNCDPSVDVVYPGEVSQNYNVVRV
ncbi:ribonuclease Oy-like isoform X1 [Halictus rubicundus]|uniref:ribonuclease Oy-like isoform X1 n=1 Tax=Halictus rubicundus TaxID=77578 RepID=UPI00403680A2